MFGYSDTVKSSPLTVTLFCRPNTVTESEEACTTTLYVQVEVLVPPAVVVRDKLVTERKGEDVTLRCAARGNPNPRITWTKKVGAVNSCQQQQRQTSNLDF